MDVVCVGNCNVCADLTEKKGKLLIISYGTEALSTEESPVFTAHSQT